MPARPYTPRRGIMLKNRQILMMYLFLAVATLMAFWQVNHCDFIDYDDNTYITENGHIQTGLTIDGIQWAFTTGHASNWHPLTWISHMADIEVFGFDPRWHHFINLLFHIANTLLLFFVLHRMTKSPWQSAFVAALFALHPLHVESVAWVAERKDVLSTFFWMLTTGAYVFYVERPGLQRYLFVLIFFALGLMAKPMLVTLPFVLLLLDYWPLGRLEPKNPAKKIQAKSGKPVAPDKRKGKSGKKHATALKEEVKTEKPADSKYRWALIISLLREKVPLFVMTILSSIVTSIVQQKSGAVGSFEIFPLSVRIENAFVSYIAYIGKTIYPHNLAIFYPYQKLWVSWHVLGAILCFFSVTFIVIWTAKKFRYLAVGWLWYVGTLVPVIGLVQVGGQAMADRYTYVPLIGLFIMAAWGIPELLGKWRYRKEVLVVLSISAILCCSIVTWTQTGYWQNNITLFSHALNVTDSNHVAYNNRGIAYAALGNYGRAIEDYNKVIEINPTDANAYYNRGIAYAALGNYVRAIADNDKVIEIDPTEALAYNNRGNAYAALGNQKQAIEDFNKATEINPKFAEAYLNRASSYDNLGNKKQAYEDLKTAASLSNKTAQDFLRSQGVSW